MIITVPFSENGVPKTGLSATINIWELTGDTLVVNADPMVEVGGGIYKYNFSTAIPGTEYAIRCDGTNVLAGYDRYVFGGTAA